MTTLADELLADLEDLQSYENEGDKQEIDVDDMEDVVGESGRKSLRDVAELWRSEQLLEMMDKILFYKQMKTLDYNGEVDEHPEYQLIVTANAKVVEIENEIIAVTKHLRDIYSKRFPELESLVSNPIDYAKTVEILRNDIKVSNHDRQLRELLSAATVMVITVTSTTTKSSPLTDAELAESLECCECILELNGNRLVITEYVESRMSIIAPNISAVVGSKTAAQLLGAAGGLKSLCSIPSCNIPMLGSSKKDLAGFSSANPNLRNGIIYNCSVLNLAIPEFRKKLVRVVSAKVALAARVDCARETPDGALGKRFRAEINSKIDKWQEPPATGGVRALDAPLEKPKVRRGGKRARKMKDRFAVTELEKQQNRMAFGRPEEEIMIFDETEGLGMINQSLGTGSVRAATVDNRVKAKVKQSTLKKLSANEPTSGLSSLVFTPVQGMELVDPQSKARKLKEINEKWFSSSAKFVNAKKEETNKNQK